MAPSFIEICDTVGRISVVMLKNGRLLFDSPDDEVPAGLSEAGVAPAGSLCITTTGIFQNTGTIGSPVWTTASVTPTDVLAALEGEMGEGQVLVGQDGDPPEGKTLSGDVTITAGGVVTLVDAAVTQANTALGLGGGTEPFTKASAGTSVIMAANADAGRVIVGMVTVTEVFANGDGAQPTFKIGNGTTDELFLASAELTGKALGTKIPFSGVLAATKGLTVKSVAGTGTTETGAIRVDWAAVQVLA